MPPKDNNTFNKAVQQHQNREQLQQAQQNGTKKAFYILLIAVGFSIFLSIISYYRSTYGDVAERRRKFEKEHSPNRPGEELAAFAQRMKAEVVSENVGLVQHDRVGGFALQIQADTPANTSLVAVPLSSCISVSNLKKKNSAAAPNDADDDIGILMERLEKFKKEEFDQNKEWLAQLGVDVTSSSSSSLEEQKEAVWEQIQLATFLIETKRFCDSSSSSSSSTNNDEKNTTTTSNTTTTNTFSHWCPWLHHVVAPSTNLFLPFSDLRWRPEVTARCLRQSTRLQYEATLLQVSALTKIFEKFSSSSSSSSTILDLKTLRSLVEWSLFILRTRSHQNPFNSNNNNINRGGETVIVPFLDMNDKRVGAHLYRKSTRQTPTAAIVFDDPSSSSSPGKVKINPRTGKRETTSSSSEPMVHLVTTERHSKGAYPLTAPASWSFTSTPPSSATSIIQNYGTVPHALPNSLQKKIFTSPISLKDESENIFAKEHLISIPVLMPSSSNGKAEEEEDEEKSKWRKFIIDSECQKNFNYKISFNISSGLPSHRTHQCFFSSSTSSTQQNSRQQQETINAMIKVIQNAQKTSILSSEALFACKSVATKQKEGFITEPVKILGGKQAQALIDVDEVIVRGGDRAKKVLKEMKKKMN